MGKKPKKMFVYVPSAWKIDAYNLMGEKKNLKGLMEWAKGAGVDMEEASRFGKGLIGKVHSLPDALGPDEEYAALSDASGFLSKELGVEVVVRKEEEGGHAKAAQAMPGKPAIILE